MIDIVERVRWLASGQDDLQSQELIACADEIERLREALRELVSINENHNAAIASIIGHHPDWKDDYLNKARAALGEGKE